MTPHTDRTEGLWRIASNRAPLKIVLKTRDDPFFLGDWVAHHAALVGAENLVILDNGSTDPGVLETYAHLRARTPILRVDGYYNDVHAPARSPDLYAALREGSDHFLFLDTDEFLAHFDGHRMVASPPMLELLRERIPGDFIPTTRLNCVPLHRDRFSIGGDDVTLRRQLKWSKPIIRSASTGWPELVNCNLHLLGALAPHAHPGFFVLHLNLLSPDQRIRNNVNKLIGRGFMRPGEPPEAVLDRPLPEKEWMIAIYVDEIRRMLPLRGATADPDAPLAPGTLGIGGGSKVAFASAVEESVFRSYVEHFADVVREVLVEGRYPPA